MPEQKQKQKQNVRQTVNVIVGAAPRRRRNVGALRRKAYQRITMQNLRDQSRREGVAKAVAAVGGIKNLKMPYETLDRAVHREQNTILFSAPEPERVKSAGLPKYAMPEAQPRERRAYLSAGANSPRRQEQRETTQAALAGIRKHRELGEQRLKVIRARVGSRELKALQPAALEAKLSPRARTRAASERLGLLRTPDVSYSSASESDITATPGVPRGIPAQRLQQLQEKIQSIHGESRTERFRHLQHQLNVATQRQPRSLLRQSLDVARANITSQ